MRTRDSFRFIALAGALSALLASASCDLGTKSGCLVDGDCVGDLTCVQGTCYDCVGDREGCGCIEGSCVGGLVCGTDDICVGCSDAASCGASLACDRGSCVACNNTFEGCPCQMGECGPGLRCGAQSLCVALSCQNGTRDGDETDIDCGGSCEACTVGLACNRPADCASFACANGSCLSIGSCLVPSSPYPSIQSAIEDPHCATIHASAGTYTEHLSVDRPVTIEGDAPADPTASPGDGETVLVGAVRTSLLEISEGDGHVTLRNLVFRNCVAAGGGAIRSGRGLTIERCAFIDNRAEAAISDDFDQPHACGGAIKVTSANVTIRDSVFLRNSATETRAIPGPALSAEAYGGAICAIGSGDILIERSEFRGNHAVSVTDVPANAVQAGGGDAYGGAIYREPGRLKISDSTFSDNVARAVLVANRQKARPVWARGGAIYGGSVHMSLGSLIENSHFLNNLAHADVEGGFPIYVGATGGALFMDTVELHGVTLQDNLVLANGAEGSPATAGGARLTTGRIESSRFWRNVAHGHDGDAGALSLLGENAIINSVFWNNIGSPASGVSVDAPDAEVWVVNSTFVDNYPSCDVFVDRGVVRLSHNASTGGWLVCGDPWNVTSEGYNVMSPWARPADLHPSDRVLEEPIHERSFRVYRGPGLPLLGSPLIDGGHAAGCIDDRGRPISVDNRGFSRDGACDVGAFSVQESEALRPEQSSMLLRQVTSIAPSLYFPDGGECEGDDSDLVWEFVRQEILGDNDRPPTMFADGLIDHPIVFRTKGSSPDGPSYGQLRSDTCSTPVLNCDDSPGAGDQTDLAFFDLEFRTEGECTSTDGMLRASAGSLGCIQGSSSYGTLHVGVSLELAETEIVGSFRAGPTNELVATIRGFLPLAWAQAAEVPDGRRALLGGAEAFSDLICPSDVVTYQDVPGVFITARVMFRHVPSVSHYSLLPPGRLELLP